MMGRGREVRASGLVLGDLDLLSCWRLAVPNEPAGKMAQTLLSMRRFCAECGAIAEKYARHRHRDCQEPRQMPEQSTSSITAGGIVVRTARKCSERSNQLNLF